MKHNTFILAIDGDVDFEPKAVRLLLDLMLRDKTVGAACGRIHPVGSGSYPVKCSTFMHTVSQAFDYQRINDND